MLDHFHCRGTSSNVSVTSSPSLLRASSGKLRIPLTSHQKEYNMPEFSDEERKRQGLKPCVHCGHFSRGTATVSQTGMSRTTEVSAWPSNRR